MKTIGKRVTALCLSVALLALSMLTLGVWSLGAKAQTNRRAVIQNIYYFNDYYPTVCYSDIESRYGSGLNINYTHQKVDSDQFDDLVYGGSFYDIPDNSLVVIDIKLFKPDVDTLNTLFEFFNDYNDCITIFVSSYHQSEFTGAAFLSYVSKYVFDPFTSLLIFAKDMASDLNVANGDLAHTVVYVDEGLIDVYEYFGSNIGTLCDISPFLRSLLDGWMEYFATRERDPKYFADYEEMLNTQQIRILVRYGSDYVDIMSWKTYTSDDMKTSNFGIDEIVTIDGISIPVDIYYGCGVGLVSLSHEVYDDFAECQRQYGEDEFRVYMYDVVNSGDDGLSVTTANRLEAEWGFADPVSELLSFLDEIL